MVFMRKEDPMNILLGKGYCATGYAEKVFHLHIRHLGNWDELYFRDYLMENPDVAAKYGQLKTNILKTLKMVYWSACPMVNQTDTLRQNSHLLTNTQSLQNSGLQINTNQVHHNIKQKGRPRLLLGGLFALLSHGIYFTLLTASTRA